MVDQTYVMLIVYVLFFIGLLYFMIVRPQKREKARKADLLSSLKKGNRVVTYAGIHGTLSRIDAGKDVVEVTVAKDVTLTMEKAAIARVLDKSDAE